MLFSTNSNFNLAKSIAIKCGLRMGRRIIDRYADKEIHVEIKEDVHKKNVFAFGSTNPPADNMLELLLLIHALKKNGARKITAVIPYLAYSKSDRIKNKGDSVSVEAVAKLLEGVGANMVITINMHSKEGEKCFKIPLKNIQAQKTFASEFMKKKYEELAVASPDQGGVLRAKIFLKHLKLKDLIVIKKYRKSYKTSAVIGITGDPRNKDIVIFDDMAQTGKTLVNAGRELKKYGAKNIYIACVHLIPTGPAIKTLTKEKSIKKIFITNSIFHSENLPAKFKIVKIDKLLAKEIKKYK